MNLITSYAIIFIMFCTYTKAIFTGVGDIIS